MQRQRKQSKRYRTEIMQITIRTDKESKVLKKYYNTDDVNMQRRGMQSKIQN